jgi:hypothetical protein
MKILKLIVANGANGMVDITGRIGVDDFEANPYPLPYTEVKEAGDGLRHAFNIYMRTGKSQKDLKTLAAKCSEQYNWFVSRFLQGVGPDRFASFLGLNGKRRLTAKAMVHEKRIEYESDSIFFPLNLLYFRNLEDPIGIEGFLGFQMEIFQCTPRAQKDYDGGHRELEVDGIALAYLDTIAGLEPQQRYFRALNRPVLAREIGTNIKSRGDILKLWKKRSGVDIVHINSHLHKDDKRVYIPLCNKVTLEPQHFATGDWTKGRKKLSLVFFNCCDSATYDHLEQLGFLNILSPDYAHGFIVTTTDVNGHLAAHFAISFYRKFLGQGKPIGKALREAREASAVWRVKAGVPVDCSVLAYCLFDLPPESRIKR